MILYIWACLALLEGIFPISCDQNFTCLNGVNIPLLSYKYRNQTWKGQYPPTSDIDQYHRLGFNTFRYSFSFDVLKPILDQEFDPTYFGIIKDNITYIAQTLNATAILDFHDGAKYRNGTIGQSPVDLQSTQFAAMWVSLVRQLPTENVMIGIMNEPGVEYEASKLQETLQQVIDSLRAANLSNYILAPSRLYQGMSTWLDTANYSLGLSDPINRTVYDIHSYFDNAGGAINCSDFETDWLRIYTNVTSVLRANDKRAFLSEIGGRATSQCAGVISSALAFLDQNADVWLGWTAWGPEQAQPSPSTLTIAENEAQGDKYSLTSFFVDCGDGDLVHQAFLKHGSVSQVQNVSSPYCTPIRDSVATAPTDLSIISTSVPLVSSMTLSTSPPSTTPQIPSSSSGSMQASDPSASSTLGETNNLANPAFLAAFFDRLYLNTIGCAMVLLL